MVVQSAIVTTSTNAIEEHKMTIIQLLAQMDSHIEQYGYDYDSGRFLDLERNIIELMQKLQLI